MAKVRVKFVCQQCGASFPKWAGKCESCGAWNSLLEQAPVAGGKSVIARSQGRKLVAEKIKNVRIDTVASRISSGFDDLDAVLGGGLMPGGVALLAGQPGIGKSTLLMQMSAKISEKEAVLYVSGEESSSQIKLRAERLGAKNSEKLDLASSVSADDVAATILDGKYKLVIVDSMQTMQMAEIASAPGTVSQITNSANIIIRAAK
ncbi:AAA family ATPase, partial [Candidatus Saccharibacteria bacterium]|nr:AAA family ATPase [Candidatus Saccharibacteria bacterium]